MDSNHFSHYTGNHDQQYDAFDKTYGLGRSDNPVFVDDYFRTDGTYVKAHVRSHPDHNPFNNYSYPGNVNPFTGEVATGDPLTYLSHYDVSFQSVLQHANPLAHIQEYTMPPLTFN
ncbi:hypothetical protein RAC89_00925 [Paenibacillus sp. GD4]|jgi:hypothetical protein|uniref:hypothetical protein n=1 Tax=Paenibacillus sp. GD4 TaxID=3068890 RepID=UPI002796CF3D|nr:hypothetical protein [Paenibacillus sp. GD4]MDQ1909062.1 hypothetical protein [Paenibacillus sp. GD4]